MKKVICILFSFVILLTSVFADKSRFYEKGKVIDTMYVNSEEGLRVRDYPSLKSNRLCGLVHRIPVKIVALGRIETIDGITAPWVEILIPRYEWKSEEPEYGWVFGGYLVKEQPEFDSSNWDSAAVKRYLMSKEWQMLVWYDNWGAVNFYENGKAEITGKSMSSSKTWTFNYQILSGKKIKITNISDTQIRSHSVQQPPTSEIYNQTYTLEFSNNLHVRTKESSALDLYYYVPADYPELFTRRELYETDDFEWHSGNEYDYKQFRNYFEFYVYEKKRSNKIQDSDIQNFIKYGLSPEGTGYEQQYHDYWNPIMEEHQKKADAMK